MDFSVAGGGEGGTLCAGTSIVGERATYEAPASLVDQPKCTPITLYQSEAPDLEWLGNQIAVTPTFVAYAIKGGKIRVLARSSATRTLLRGHAATIVDLSAFDEGDNCATLASVCADGRVVVWALAAFDVEERVDHELVEQSARPAPGRIPLGRRFRSTRGKTETPGKRGGGSASRNRASLL